MNLLNFIAFVLVPWALNLSGAVLLFFLEYLHFVIFCMEFSSNECKIKYEKISLVCCFLNRQGRDYVSEGKYNSAYVYVLRCIAALAGLMFGYSTAVMITGVVLPLQQYYQLTPTETG